MAEYTFNVQFNVFFPLSHLQSVCNQIVIHSGYTYVSPVRNICDPDQNIWLAKMVLGCLVIPLLKPLITCMIHRGSKGTGANAQWIWSAGTTKKKTEETLLKYSLSTLHNLKLCWLLHSILIPVKTLQPQTQKGLLYRIIIIFFKTILHICMVQ